MQCRFNSGFRIPMRARCCAAALLATAVLLPCTGLATRATPAPPAPTTTPPVIAEELPDAIAEMIRIAQQEVAAAYEQKVPKSNKYSQWYFHDKREIGWCSNFVSWCADQAGLPLYKEENMEPLAEDIVFVTNEAKVERTREAFEKAERLVEIPRPGYLIIYGVLGSTNSTHVGMVESVWEVSDGVYEITTLEGNVSSTVKRYCIRYLLDPPQRYHNLKAVPQDEQTRTDAQYKLHKENWYISGFGATWL